MNAAVHPAPRIIPVIVRQHVEDAASLHTTRSALVNAPHVRLRHLNGFDERVSAHLEGVQIAGTDARQMCTEALEIASPGTVFVATLCALDTGDRAWLEQLLALCEAEPECRRGLASAFGWTEKGRLRGIVADYLKSELPFRRLVALTACSQHRVDPNLVAAGILADAEPRVRARAYRIAGELGKRELVSGLAQVAITEEDPDCRFWGAWAAVILGDRRAALERIKEIALQPGPHHARAFQLAFQAADLPAARGLLQSIAHDAAQIRQLMRGAGASGDPVYIPRLIDLMRQDEHARLAGEAFAFVTGVDAEWLDLERLRPEGFASGPNDDPEDPHVDLNEDDGLPWPEADRVQSWWAAHSHRFQPGVRYFMGEPVNRSRCLRTLREGFQRQRSAAALHLCLLDPGVPLFEWRAPALRQMAQLGQMS